VAPGTRDATLMVAVSFGVDVAPTGEAKLATATSEPVAPIAASNRIGLYCLMRNFIALLPSRWRCDCPFDPVSGRTWPGLWVDTPLNILSGDSSPGSSRTKSLRQRVPGPRCPRPCPQVRLPSSDGMRRSVEDCVGGRNNKTDIAQELDSQKSIVERSAQSGAARGRIAARFNGRFSPPPAPARSNLGRRALVRREAPRARTLCPRCGARGCSQPLAPWPRSADAPS
jgi:hypothetical protein